MTLINLIKKMDKGYYNERILPEALDNKDVGDGLATFIVQEAKDIVGNKKKLTNKDIDAVRNGLMTARDELNQVIEMLW